MSSVVGEFRTCTKTGCRWPAAASLTYRYASQQVWLTDLAPERDPNLWDLCPHHAKILTAPRGWELVDQRTEAPAVVEPAAPDRLPERAGDRQLRLEQEAVVAQVSTDQASKPVVEPVAEPAAEPVAEPAAEPVAEPVAEPATEPVVEPVRAQPARVAAEPPTFPPLPSPRRAQPERRSPYADLLEELPRIAASVDRASLLELADERFIRGSASSAADTVAASGHADVPPPAQGAESGGPRRLAGSHRLDRPGPTTEATRSMQHPSMRHPSASPRNAACPGVVTGTATATALLAKGIAEPLHPASPPPAAATAEAVDDQRQLSLPLDLAVDDGPGGVVLAFVRPGDGDRPTRN